MSVMDQKKITTGNQAVQEEKKEGEVVSNRRAEHGSARAEEEQEKSIWSLQKCQVRP